MVATAPKLRHLLGSKPEHGTQGTQDVSLTTSTGGTSTVWATKNLTLALKPRYQLPASTFSLAACPNFNNCQGRTTEHWSECIYLLSCMLHQLQKEEQEAISLPRRPASSWTGLPGPVSHPDQPNISSIRRGIPTVSCEQGGLD
jgi:hypothetical protein